MIPKWEYHYCCGLRKSPRRVNFHARIMQMLLTAIPQAFSIMMGGRY